MSGGVDSSVTALLKEQGYDVIVSSWRTGTTQMKTASVRRPKITRMWLVAPDWHSLLLCQFWKKSIGTAFWVFPSEYCRAHPNPDVMCNKEISLRPFWTMPPWPWEQICSDWALCPCGAWWGCNRSHASWRGQWQGSDHFLSQLSQEQLKTMFPLGHLEKPEVRS